MGQMLRIEWLLDMSERDLVLERSSCQHKVRYLASWAAKSYEVICFDYQAPSYSIWFILRRTRKLFPRYLPDPVVQSQHATHSSLAYTALYMIPDIAPIRYPLPATQQKSCQLSKQPER